MTIVVLAGCSNPIVRETDVPGTYLAQTDWGTSTLTISPGHTFQQTVQPAGAAAKTITGRWTLSRQDGNPPFTTISFTPFLRVTHDVHGDSAYLSLSAIYRNAFGRIQIAADPSAGIVYRKQSAR